MSKATLKLESIILTSTITACVTLFVIGNLVTFINVEKNVSKQNKLRPFLLNLQHHFSHHGFTNLGAKLRHYINEKPSPEIPAKHYDDFEVTSRNIEETDSIKAIEQNSQGSIKHEADSDDTDFSLKDSVYVKEFIRGCDKNVPWQPITAGRKAKGSITFVGDIPDVQKQIIREGIRKNLKRVFSYFRFRGIKLTYVTEINMQIFADYKEYQNALRAHGITIRNIEGTKTNGVYSPYHNKSFIIMRHDDNKTINSAAHEAIHSILYTNFGLLNTTIDEGLATYLSAVRRNKNSARWVNSVNWLDKVQEDKMPLGFYELFSKESHQWRAKDVLHHYASSWVWMSYLLLNDKTSPIIINALNYKAYNRCHKLDIEQITMDLLYVHPNIKGDFEKWFLTKTRR
ncbi:hypothetical protein C1E24_20645 [Pseudoalteromonas phenolica]|uniref:DUF1570 domain-containing protein n=1 Tax=Pseudoalteromonas phenolica TaxID=161398 RepID=A0A5R9PW15_9GAMM|nr:hypothetical protein [Pseudoalteromonas phenolica]TLX45103.1 hypothetical protein C1E24_20645 [Pseudoalteromonas phenolica]